ncbi:MAG TPA: OmpA family protein [Chlamydiales bacterium]|nr:OmpA family protein [Chlamydiales bacterium]
MKKVGIFSLTLLLTMSFFSCQKNSNETWENVKTAGNYLHKGIDSLWSGDKDSKLLGLNSQNDGPQEEDYLPLEDSDLRSQFKATDTAIAQSSKTAKSGIPNYAHYKKPSNNTASIFKNIYFPPDGHVVQEKEDLQIIADIVRFLKKNRSANLIIEGHCDETMPASYNMALGTRRANQLRVLLIKQGVDSNRLFTVSYGKEKPIALGHTKNDWAKNRRVEFKLYER